MLRKKKNDLEWMEFELLQEFPTVKHGVFVNLDLGERGNREDQLKILDLFQVQGGKLRQVHKDGLVEIKAQTEKLSYHENYDGMVTQEKNIGLLIRHADCQSAIFYDPRQKALANVHCGWRGSVQNIYQKTIQALHDLYGSQPSDLHVCIGPSLGPQFAEFKHYREELPKNFWSFQVKPEYFDFWAISQNQLIQAGVPKKQIEIAEICTYENREECFSYRRNPNTPHHGTLATLTSL